jgi:hypothetical protein
MNKRIVVTILVLLVLVVASTEAWFRIWSNDDVVFSQAENDKAISAIHHHMSEIEGD